MKFFRWFFPITVILLLINCSVLQPGGQIQSEQNPPVEKATPIISNNQEPSAAPPTQTPDSSSGGYENSLFSFKTPSGWNVHEGPSATGKNAPNYMALNMNILVEVRKYGFVPLITITNRAIPPGSSLEQEFNATYANPEPAINHEETAQTTVDGMNAMVKKYNRPWGEPWYSFQDTWLEKNGQIYMISCETKLNPTPEDLAICQTVLDSLHFKASEENSSSPTPAAAAEASGLKALILSKGNEGWLDW